MRLRNFSLVLTILGGLLLAQLTLAGANPLWAQYVTGPKLTIINNSGHPASQIHLVFLARPFSETLGYNTHRIKWGDKTFPIINPADDTVTFGDYNYANYSTTLDKLSRDPATGNYYFFLPKKENSAVPNNKAGFDSGRLWISFKTPCYFRVTNLPPPDGVGHLTYAAPALWNASDPNVNTVFDFFEPMLAVSVDGTTCTVKADTSNIESVAMPLLYQLYNNETLVGNKTKGLNRPLRELRQPFLADPVFKSLVTPVGVLAPGHGIDINKFPPDYYNNYINYCWDYWKDNLLAFVYYNTWWSGTVDPTSHTLALTGWYGGATETHYIGKPTGKEVFYCNGVFNGTGDDSGSIPTWWQRDAGLKNQVASALNRTVFHLAPYPSLSQIGQYPWQAYAPPNGSQINGQTYMFYQQNGLSNANYQTNVYSKILHALSYDGTIYGFPYDDNADQSSYIEGVATEIKLTISNSLMPSTASLLNLLLDS